MFSFIPKKAFKNIALIVLSCTSLIGCSSDNISNTNNTAAKMESTYADEASTNIFDTDTFSIDLGNKWLYDKEASETAAQLLNVTCYYFYFAEDGISPTSDHITITVDNLSNTGKDFDTFKDVVIKQIQVSDYTYTDVSNEPVNGYETWRIEYKTTGSDNESYNYLTCINVENVIYSSTFTSYKETYEDGISLADEFILSATFK